MATDKKTPKKTSKKKTPKRGGKTLKADSSRRITSAGRGGATTKKGPKKAAPTKRKTATRRKSARTKSSKKRGIVKTLVLWSSVLAIWGVVLLGGVIGWYAWD